MVYKQVLQIEASGAGCDTRAQALEGMDYKRFMNADGTRNWFMWDNAYDDERIKRYYTDAELVREEYAKAFHTDCAEPCGSWRYWNKTEHGMNTTFCARRFKAKCR